MAVVQISRIQIRRGKSGTGTGLPQLASGELAWSLDTQELYIGSGSVSEGSPSVGNVKILTENDLTASGNILNLVNFIYRANDTEIQTGPTINKPVSRFLQDRLDDEVTVADFIHPDDVNSGDLTTALQRAIDQLFLNPSNPANVNDAAGYSSRVILRMGPGIYPITSTIYIPSFASIVGSGSDKTSINFTGTGPVFQFVNDTSTPGHPSPLSNTSGLTQPRNVALIGMTIYTESDDQQGVVLDAVKDSLFEDLLIKGNWNGPDNDYSRGVEMNAKSSLVTCENNLFRKVRVTGFNYAVWAKQDTLNNSFRDCSIYGESNRGVRQGFVLGLGADSQTVGEQYGPRKTQILNCDFKNIYRHAVYIGLGTGNTMRDVRLTNVGNNGAGVYFPEYPQIYLGSVGNSVYDQQSDREESLSSSIFTVDLELSHNITATQPGYLIQQDQGGGLVIAGNLKTTYASDNNITVITQYLTPFNTNNFLTINGNITPGDLTTIDITGSTTTEFITTDSTDELRIGTEIVFSGALGGITPGTSYWVQSISGSNNFSISNSLGGPQRPLSVTVGTMTGDFNASVKPTVVGALTLVPYLPEVTGYGTYRSYSTKQIQIGLISSPSLVSLLPLPTGPTGNPINSITYKIDYMYRSVSLSYTRQGTMTIVVNVPEKIVQFTDDYSVIGISDEQSLPLEFSAVLLNETGSPVGPLDDPYSIALRWKNTLAIGSLSDSGSLAYTYTAIL